MASTESIEIQLILEAIFLKYGYDFRQYSRASVKRRLKYFMVKNQIRNYGELQHDLIHDSDVFESLLLELSINVTEMFRDPSYFKVVRESVIPVLKTYPFIKIWHAGCSTGEEVYSMAILLKEEGLLNKCIIYATDMNETVLKKAKEGIYPLEKIKEYTINYQKAGGDESFADYYTAKYNAAIMSKSLNKNLVFAQHNLATDHVFGEMNLIICRNVLIYFDKELQNRAVGLFHESLVRKGVLCLGSKESLKFTRYTDKFNEFNGKEKIYRKID